MAVLVWDSPRGRNVYPLDRAITVVGRDEVSDIPLEDVSVSRRHALIQATGERLQVTDLGSTGGTRINGAALVPNLPSTLEPGDFVNFGRLTMTFHLTPPPAVAPAAAAQAMSAAPPAPAALPAARPWLWITVGGACLLLGAAGAYVLLRLERQPSSPPPPVHEGQSVARPDVLRPPTGGEEPAPLPMPVESAPPPSPGESAAAETPAEPPPAPDGALPPATEAPIDLFPDLLEIDGQGFLPARVRDWDKVAVQAIGTDGRLYRVPRARIERILDRADLARRASSRRAELAADDAEGRRELALWCRARLLLAEARELAREILKLRPSDAAAQELIASLGGG